MRKNSQLDRKNVLVQAGSFFPQHQRASAIRDRITRNGRPSLPTKLEGDPLEKFALASAIQ